MLLLALTFRDVRTLLYVCVICTMFSRETLWNSGQTGTGRPCFGRATSQKREVAHPQDGGSGPHYLVVVSRGDQNPRPVSAKSADTGTGHPLTYPGFDLLNLKG